MRKLLPRLGLAALVLIAALLVVRPASAAPLGQQARLIHVVGWGETLFSIARRYGISVEAIVAINGIADATRIHVGQRLTIPGVEAAPSVVETAAVAGGTHVVQPGENLFRIALRFGTTAQALAELNGIYNVDHVAAGQELIIPGSPTTPSPAYQPQHASTTHTVQRGETLSSIAHRYGVSVWTLVQINSIPNSSFILAGQVLAIPEAGSLAPAPGPASPSGSSPGGKRIVVDLSDQHLYAYNSGALVYSFVASTGEAGRRTAPGSYRVLDKIPNAYAYTWSLQMPHWLGIYWAGSLENGIHALPILSNGQRLWAGYLGTPISYGCIVLGVEEARMLYNWAEVGTTVIVQY